MYTKYSIAKCICTFRMYGSTFHKYHSLAAINKYFIYMLVVTLIKLYVIIKTNNIRQLLHESNMSYRQLLN